MGLWINEREYVEFAVDRKSLIEEIAPRSRSVDWLGLMTLLPDPDPVLEKTGESLEAYRGLLADAHVWSCYQSRKSGTLSCEWEVREPEAGGESANRRALEACVQVMERVDAYQAINDMLDAVFFGIAPVEVMWKPGSLWAPENLIGRPPEWFAFDTENRLRFMSRDNMAEGELVPDMKFLLPRHHANFRNPYGERTLSRCFWPVFFKKAGWKFWGIFAEKFGLPWVVGKVPRGTNETDRDRMLTALTNMVQDATAVINNDESIDFPESWVKTGTSGLFGDLISSSNREISKAILGQTLTTEIDQGGSYAAAKEHMEVRADLIDQDKRMVAAEFNRLFGWIVKLNFEGTTPPEFHWFEEEDLQGDRAERDSELKNQGVDFLRPYYRRTYNLADEDFRLASEGGPAGEEPDAEVSDGDEEKVEFAQDPTAAEALAGQDEVDRLVEASAAEGGAAVSRNVDLVRGFLSGAKTLEDAAERITDVWDSLGRSGLVDVLSGALEKADRAGADSVPRPAEFEAVWGPGKPFEEAVDFFKAKALTISGQTNQDLLGDVKAELLRAMKEGLTLDDFRAGFDEIAGRHGWTGYTPWRVKTIFETNLQAAYQAGRYRQMTDPAVLAALPYWRYIAVRDGSTRPTHLAMHGRIWRADHPMWRNWYPPNGFNCRCTVIAVSQSQIERNGWRIEEDDPTGKLIEPIDPVGGQRMPARPMMPDRGFSGRGGSLEAMLDGKTAGRETGRVTWSEVKGQPGPAELGRPKTADIPQALWRPSPGKLLPLEEMTSGGMTRSEALASLEDEFRRVMGISPKEDFGVLKNPLGAAVEVDLNSLAHAMLKRGDARERYIRYFRRVIEEPYEILLVEYEDGGGLRKLREKYIGLFMDERREGVVITAEITPDRRVVWNLIPVRRDTLNRQRRGRRALYGRA